MDRAHALSHRYENDALEGDLVEPHVEVRALIARRLKVGLAVAVVANVAFLLADLRFNRGAFVALGALKLAQVAIIVGAVLLLHRPRSLDAVRWIAAGTACSYYLTIAAAGVLRGDAVTAAYLLVGLCMGTAALLPWGVRCQVVTTAVAAAAMLIVLDLSVGFGPRLVFPVMGVGLAFAGSVLIAYEHERTRRERARTAGLLAGQTRILEMIAIGRPLPDILEVLTARVEGEIEGMLCSVLILEDGCLRHGAAPSLPAAYCQAIDGTRIGPAVGSCGTAAHRRETVVVSDIAADPLWADFRELALAHGLRACWSAPILAVDGRCLGTFAMYYREPCAPRAAEQRLIARAAHLAGVAIERHQAEAVLAASRRQLEDESQVAAALARAGQILIASLSTAGMLDRLCEFTTEILGCDCSDAVMRAPGSEALVPMAAHGYAPEELESLRALRLPSGIFTHLFEYLERDGIAQVRTTRLEDATVAGMVRRYGVTLSMYLPLRRGDTIVGVLFAGFRGRTRPFSAVQQRIAVGIAQLASIALENTRLVEELTRANQIKSEFVSTMSHELRTPLSVILGYTDVLRDDLARRDQHDTLDRIRRSGLELLEMVEATLDLNRLEAGKDPAVVEEVWVPDLLDELQAEYAAVGAPAGTALVWETAPAVTLLTDRRKLRIILKNLIGNALKFTPAGEVRVSCAPGAAGCEFRVRDTGIGIDPAQIAVIFEMFRQADGSDSRAHGGVGLGLYITRRLVTQLGGEVAVESAPGQGTTFTVSLPLAASLEKKLDLTG